MKITSAITIHKVGGYSAMSTSDRWLGEIQLNQDHQIFPIVLTWPADPLPDLSANPLLYIRVTFPRDQAILHRYLAKLGYVPDVIEETPNVDYWRFYHPDGPRPVE